MKFTKFLKESNKQDKSEVNYRHGTLENHCAHCTMFIKPSSCTAVKGDINWDDVCDLFERKATKPV